MRDDIDDSRRIHTAARATYNVVEGELVIHGMRVTDPVVLGEICHWSTGTRGPAVASDDLDEVDLSPFCRQALAAGALAIRGAGGTQEAHHLDRLIAEVTERASSASMSAARATTDAADRVSDGLTKAADDAKKTICEEVHRSQVAFNEQIAQSRNTLLEEVNRLVGGSDPMLASKLDGLLTKFTGQLDERVTQRTDALFDKAARQLDPRDPTSPMAAVARQLSEQHSSLVGQLTVGQRELAERLERLSVEVNVATATSTVKTATTLRTTMKGDVFEENVAAQLEAFAISHGDEYINTANEVGTLPRCRKGDGVLVTTLDGGSTRVVIEVTDSAKPRSWNDYLEMSERNRDAAASLGIVPSVEQLGGDERLRSFGPRRFVLAHDPTVDDPALLNAVLLLLRGQAILAATRSGGENARIADLKINEALTCLTRIADIQKSAGTVRRSADKIESDSAWLETAIRRLLTEAMAAIGRPDDLSSAAA